MSMGTYAAPANVPVSCNWQCHRDRPNGGSPEPGTDYKTGYGTDLAMAGDGVVAIVDMNPGGGEGRRLSINLDDGRRVDYIHLASISVKVGARVKRGQKGVCLSGASGNGSDWYYGPHVHVSLWERPGMAYRDTIDFEKYVGNVPTPTPPGGGDDEEEEMGMKGAAYTRASDKVTVFLLFNEVSGFWVEHSGVPGQYNNSIAQNWQTGSWPTITESHARVIKTALNTVRQKTITGDLSVDIDAADALAADGG